MLETYKPMLVINNIPMLETYKPILVINNMPMLETYEPMLVIPVYTNVGVYNHFPTLEAKGMFPIIYQ